MKTTFAALLASVTISLADTNAPAPLDFAKVSRLTDLRLVDGQLYDFSGVTTYVGFIEREGGNAVLSMTISWIEKSYPPREGYYTYRLLLRNYPQEVPRGTKVQLKAIRNIKTDELDCGVPYSGDIHAFRSFYRYAPNGKLSIIPIPTREEFAAKLESEKAKVATARKKAQAIIAEREAKEAREKTNEPPVPK